MGFVTSLEKVTASAMTPIVSVGIGALKPAHGVTKIAPSGLDNEVVVIWHETIHMQDSTECREHFFEGLEKKFPILIVLEDFFSFIAPGSDVVASPFVFNADRSCHAS